jgi:hypothetical protein
MELTPTPLIDRPFQTAAAVLSPARRAWVGALALIIVKLG